MVDFDDKRPTYGPDESTPEQKAAAAQTVRAYVKDPEHQAEVLECLGLVPTVYVK